MAKVFPSTDIRAIPHINSKIHVWKKNYGSLVTMLSRSGVGWNDITKMIEATDDAWDSVVKVDTNARLMRYKAWPYYHDWCEIFGKDRATREQAEDVMDAVNDLCNSDKNKETDLPNDFNILLDDFEDETENISVCQPAHSGSGKKSIGKKRKLVDGSDSIYEMLGSFCRNTEARLGDIARRIGYEYDMSTARKEVFEAVGKIGGLTLQEKLMVSDDLVKNTERLELFSSLPENARCEFVQMMLAGKL